MMKGTKMPVAPDENDDEIPERHVYPGITDINVALGNFAGYPHYYAELWSNDGSAPRIDLSYKLTKTQALRLSDGTYKYEEGQKCHRFFSKDDALQQAIKMYKVHFPDAVRLWEGRPAQVFKHLLDGHLDGTMNIRMRLHQGRSSWSEEVTIEGSTVEEAWAWAEKEIMRSNRYRKIHEKEYVLDTVEILKLNDMERE